MCNKKCGRCKQAAIFTHTHQKYSYTFWIMLVTNTFFSQMQPQKKKKKAQNYLEYITFFIVCYTDDFVGSPLILEQQLTAWHFVINFLMHIFFFFFHPTHHPISSKFLLILTSHTPFFSQFLAVSPSNSCRPVLFFNTSIRYCAAAAIFWRKLSSQMGMWSALPPRTILYWSFSLIKAEWARVEK